MDLLRKFFTALLVLDIVSAVASLIFVVPFAKTAQSSVAVVFVIFVIIITAIVSALFILLFRNFVDEIISLRSEVHKLKKQIGTQDTMAYRQPTSAPSISANVQSSSSAPANKPLGEKGITNILKSYPSTRGEKCVLVSGEKSLKSSVGFKCPYCNKLQNANTNECKECYTPVKYTAKD